MLQFIWSLNRTRKVSDLDPRYMQMGWVSPRCKISPWGRNLLYYTSWFKPGKKILKYVVFNPGVEIQKILEPCSCTYFFFLQNLLEKMITLDKKTLSTLLSTTTSLLIVSLMLLKFTKSIDKIYTKETLHYQDGGADSQEIWN